MAKKKELVKEKVTSNSKVSSNNESSERKEALMRLVVGIVTGIILYLWSYVSYVVIFFAWIYTLITGERNKALADFVEYWTSTMYLFFSYMSGMNNNRPFPFSELKLIGKFVK